MITLLGRVRWSLSWPRRTSLKAGDQRRFLAADIGAAAAPQIDLKSICEP